MDFQIPVLGFVSGELMAVSLFVLFFAWGSILLSLKSLGHHPIKPFKWPFAGALTLCLFASIGVLYINAWSFSVNAMTIAKAQLVAKENEKTFNKELSQLHSEIEEKQAVEGIFQKIGIYVDMQDEVRAILNKTEPFVSIEQYQDITDYAEACLPDDVQNSIAATLEIYPIAQRTVNELINEAYENTDFDDIPELCRASFYKPEFIHPVGE